MTAALCQRWRDRRDSYRPAGETIRTGDYEVAAIADDATPKAFVLAHHYSGTFPAARFRFGLYRKAALVGVAVFSQPVNNRSLNVFGAAARSVLAMPDSVELGRFVLLDGVPANGETWFLARAFELLRRGESVAGVVSVSDPVPREDAGGRRVFPGHLGTIYQAFNAVYLGRGTARTLALLPDGRVLSARSLQKIRRRERGHRYAEAQLERHGAAPLGDRDPVGWLAEWLPRLTRPLRHPGNHKYVWAVDRRLRKALPESLPYPKNLGAAPC